MKLKLCTARRSNPFFKNRLIATCSTLSLVAVAATMPNAARAEAAATDGSPTIEMVTVTAEKVVSDLQTTAISVSAVSAATLNESNVTSFDSLNGQLPNLIVNNIGAAYPMALSVRGVGFTGLQNNSAQPGVSLNENGVYIASQLGLNSDYLDLNQLELIRGPQGSVLGKNSDGGAVNLTTVQPVLGTYGGEGEVGYGSYNLVDAHVAANVPIGDTFALRIAAQEIYHAGWAHATDIPGQPDFPLSNENSQTYRVTGLWQPVSALSVAPWVEIYQSSANGAAQKNIFDPNPNPRELTQDYPSTTPATSQVYALPISYNFDWATAKSITSYQHSTQGPDAEDVDALNFSTAATLYGNHDLQPINIRKTFSWTQEVNLTSNAGGSLDWIVGAFYMHEISETGYTQFDVTTPNASPPASLNFTAADLGTLYGEGFVFGDIGTEVDDSESIYGQGTYHFNDQLSAVAGVRYTSDIIKGADEISYAPVVDTTASYSRFSGKASLQYAVTQDNTVYGLWSLGIKPGGTNVNTGSLVIPQVFLPETVSAFEVGSKNEFFNDRARVNLSAYYNLIDNYQFDSEDPLPFHGGMTNASKAHTYGVEAEFNAFLTNELRLDGNLATSYGFIDSHTEGLDPVVAQGVNLVDGTYTASDIAQRFTASQDLYGHTLPNVPPFSGAIALSQIFDLKEDGIVTPRVQFVFRSSYEARVYNNPNTDTVPWMRQWNLSIDYQPKVSAWYAQFQIINVTDSSSVATRYSDNFGSGEVTNYYIPPRQFIAKVGYNF